MPGLVSNTASVLLGLATAVSGFLVHEWGHWLGARFASAQIDVPASYRSVFLFRFDHESNSPRQFLVMSMGGFVATALVTGAFIRMVPWHTTAGITTWVLTGLGILVTAAIELPDFVRVLRGGAIPKGRMTLRTNRLD